MSKLLNVAKKATPALLLGSMAAEAMKTPEVKKAPAKRVMPTPDDEAIRMAKKRSVARQMSRSGRAATIMGGGSSSGGGYGG